MAQVIAYLLFSRNNLICDKLLKNIMYCTKIFSIFPKIMVLRTSIPMFHSFPPQGTCKRQYLSFPKGFCKIYLHNPEEFAPLEVQPVIQEARKISKMQKVRPTHLYTYTYKPVLKALCAKIAFCCQHDHYYQTKCAMTALLLAHLSQKCAHSRDNT